MEPNLSFFDDLENELVVEILIRLPAETAVSCKAVCKRWLSLISDNYFITRFTQHRQNQPPQPNNPVTIVFRENINFLADCSETQLISEHFLLQKRYGDNPGSHTRSLPFVPNSFSFQDIYLSDNFLWRASFADVLLCSYLKHDHTSSQIIYYYVYNLLTDQWVAIPPININKLMESTGWVGLLFDPINAGCKFRVVRIMRYMRKLQMQIFSSKEGRWSERRPWVHPSLPTSLEIWSDMVACNKMLHLLTTQGILVLDLFNESVQVSRVIVLPPEVRNQVGEACLRECQGQLHLGVILWNDRGHSTGPIVKVWDVEGWCLKHNIYLRNPVLPFFSCANHIRLDYFQILSFHPNDINILYLKIDDLIVKFNVQEEKFEESGQVKRATSTLSAYPLVHQWWPTPLF